MAGNGPRSVRYAARTGDGWVATGVSAQTDEAWWAALDVARQTLEEALVAAGRDPAMFPRYLLLDNAPQFGAARFSLQSVGLFEEMAGRAGSSGSPT